MMHDKSRPTGDSDGFQQKVNATAGTSVTDQSGLWHDPSERRAGHSFAATGGAAPAFDRITAALADTTGFHPRQSGRNWMARCPAHNDRNPSLSITPIDGSVLLHCFAGCDVDSILAALGWSRRDLYDTPGGQEYRYLTPRGHVSRVVRRIEQAGGKKRFEQKVIDKGAP